MTEHQKTPKTILNQLFDIIKPSDVILILGLFVILSLLAGIYIGGGKFLILLKDSEVSRGLITFLVALTTVLLAIILALYAITSEENKEIVKERFSLGKDVLATLVGILGTVLGFYFGSAEKTIPNQLGLAEIHYQGQQLMTHVSGGTPPYRYSVTSANKLFSNIEGRLSKDGWILETLDKQPPAGTPIIVQVSDAKDKTVSFESNYPVSPPTEEPSQGAASSIPTSKTASTKTGNK